MMLENLPKSIKSDVVYYQTDLVKPASDGPALALMLVDSTPTVQIDVYIGGSWLSGQTPDYWARVPLVFPYSQVE